MTKQSNGSEQPAVEQPPSGISTEDWANTPASVRELVKILYERRRERKREPKNSFPIFFTLVFNLGVIALLTIFLEGKVTFRCIAPHQIGPLSVATISLVSIHLIWRSVYAIIPSNPIGEVKFGGFTIPFTIFTTFFNEMQVWKLRSLYLKLLLIGLVIAGAILNLTPMSPFYIPDDLFAIQAFIINRYKEDSSNIGLKEGIPVGGTLTLSNNEIVFVEATFRGEDKSNRNCLWYSRMSSTKDELGCSIVLDQVSGPTRDTLTVRTQSACGTQVIGGIDIVVLP